MRPKVPSGTDRVGHHHEVVDVRLVPLTVAHVPDLLAALTTSRPVPSGIVGMALLDLGTSALPALRTALESGTAPARALSASLLGLHGDLPATAALTAALDDGLRLDDHPLTVAVPGQRHGADAELLLDGRLQRLCVVEFGRRHGGDGRVAAGAAHDLVQQFDYVGDPQHVVIDLSDAQIYDSSTVATLDSIELKYRQRGKQVEIVGLNEPSREWHTRLSGQLGAEH